METKSYHSIVTMKRLLCATIFISHLLTIVLSYDPATCIECRKSHMCKQPDCFCCRDEMPLGKHRIPQMVFFSFDDAVTPQVAGYYKELFDSKRKNPNGCPISMTLFISHSNTVYRLVREFYDKGMEIASHSVTHGHPNAQTFIREAKKQRENLAKKARIPKSEIVGWRSPFLEPLGDTQPSVLKQLGYKYDATLTITKKSNTDKAVTPFTLDYGWPYDCKIKQCPTKSHKGFWEVPVVSVKDYLNKYDCVYVDGCNNPPPSENLAFKFLWDNFQRYYKGNRAPMGVNMHASWFYYPDRKKAMDRFIKELVKMDDVYILSIKQVIAWLKQPTPLHRIKNFKPWQCNSANTTVPNSVRQKTRMSVRNQEPKKVDRSQLYQKMAEQRNQWRRQHLQRRQHRLQPHYSNRQIIPSSQPIIGRPLPPPTVFSGPGPIPIGPSGPPIPPLAPAHPMINFWWQPPPSMLPPEVHHELEIRRNIELQQMEHERRQAALNRERIEQERVRRLEAQRAEEEQRLLMIKRQQEEQRKRQELVKRQEAERQRRQLELKQREEKRRQQLEQLRRRKAESIRRKEAITRKQKTIQTQRQKSQMQRNHKQDSNVLVEYLSTANTVKSGSPISNIDIVVNRPPLREVHEQQLIKEKLKLHPDRVKKEHVHKQKELTSASAQNNFDKNIKNKDIHDKKLPIEKATSPNIANPANTISKSSNNDAKTHSKLLDNLLNYNPSERIKYLNDLSLDDLKSLQAELRRRLANDPSPTKASNTPSSERQIQSTDTIPGVKLLGSKLTKTTEIPSSVKVTTTQPIRISEAQNVPPAENTQKSLLTISSPSVSMSPLRNKILPKRNLRYQFAQIVTTELTATTTPIPTTTVTELMNVYNGVTDKITALTTKSTEQTTTEATTMPIKTTTTTTAAPTESVTQTVISTEPAYQITTKRPRVRELGGKSLWQISDIFDMNNRMGDNTAKPVKMTFQQKSPKVIPPLLPTRSLSLFSVQGYTRNDALPASRIIKPINSGKAVIAGSRRPSPTIVSQPVSMPALYSKSLFKVNGFDISRPIVPKGLTFTSKDRKQTNVTNRDKPESPHIQTLDTASGTVQTKGGIDAYLSELPSRHASSMVNNLPVQPQLRPKASWTPLKTNSSTMFVRKPMVNRSLQQLVKPVNLFENNFSGVISNIQTSTPAAKAPTPVPKAHTNDQFVKSGTAESPPTLQMPEYFPSPESITADSGCQQEVNCFAPDCICKTDTTPNNISARKLPQIVYITIDGSLNFHTYSKIRHLFSPSRVNPNGCRIKGTFFMTDAGSSYRIADLLHSKGLEIGLSGLSSRPQKTAKELESNIMLLTDQLTTRTTVSPIEIRGWRSPGFKTIGDKQFSILSNYSLYDSSLVTNRHGKMAKLWPFTLDFGWKEDCGERSCPTKYHPGVMEVPVIPFTGPGNSTACEYTDGCTRQPESEQETIDYLMNNFNTYYKTNRAPFAIRLKQIWFHWYYKSNLRGLIKFLDKILGYKDVYVTSVTNMLDWVKDPTPLNQLDSFPPWKC